MMLHIREVFVAGAVVIGMAGSGCAPAFQDARLVGRGRAEVTPNISAVRVAAEGESEHIANNFGAHVMVGVHDRLDVGVGYTRLEVVDEDAGLNFVGFGPKVGIVRDRVAFALPVGFAFGDDIDVSETFTLQPTALLTVPAGAHVDINPSVKLLIPTCEDCETLVGFGIGVGIKTADQRVNVRPEVAFLRNPGEPGTVWSFGVGVSFRTR